MRDGGSARIFGPGGRTHSEGRPRRPSDRREGRAGARALEGLTPMFSTMGSWVVMPVAQQAGGLGSLAWMVPIAIFGLAVFLGLVAVSGVRYIPNSKVGVVEKLWSGRGSIPEGRIVALQGEAGIHADV